MSSSSAIDSASLDGPASPSLASARTITNDSEHEHTTAFTPGYDTEQVKEVFQVTSSPDSLPPLAVSWRLEDEKTRRNEVSFWTGSLCGSLISLICMCIGLGLTIAEALKDRPDNQPSALMGHMKLEDLLLSLKLGQTATPPDEKLSEAVAIPLAVAFSFFVLLSLSAICLSISGLRDAQQDLKRISNPHGTMQEENRRRVNTWWRIAKHFKTKPEEVKKPQLPTYAYAVRQAVLKRGTRQGDPQEEFHRISMEEMELERIAKLGGAPPLYRQVTA